MTQSDAAPSAAAHHSATPATGEVPDLSIILVNWNSLPFTDAALSSLRETHDGHQVRSVRRR